MQIEFIEELENRGKQQIESNSKKIDDLDEEIVIANLENEKKQEELESKVEEKKNNWVL